MSEERIAELEAEIARLRDVKAIVRRNQDLDQENERLRAEAAEVQQVRSFWDGVQALLGVLNDIGGGNPWKYNVITEAAEDALHAALQAMGLGKTA